MRHRRLICSIARSFGHGTPLKHILQDRSSHAVKVPAFHLAGLGVIEFLFYMGTLVLHADGIVE